MKKYFCISDVHGFYDEMISALHKSGYDQENPSHIFVSCGDLLDRGSHPSACLNFVNRIPTGKKILIRGNHEILLEEMLKRGTPHRHDYKNGTFMTMIDSYCENHGDIGKTTSDVFKWFQHWNIYLEYKKSLVDYFETPKYVFAHGWIPCQYDNEEKIYFPLDDWRSGDWGEASWVCGWRANMQGVKADRKTVVCGHWSSREPNTLLKKKIIYIDDPYIDEGIVCLDGTTVVSRQVNCVVLEDE